jgi:hypothetical protein
VLAAGWTLKRDTSIYIIEFYLFLLGACVPASERWFAWWAQVLSSRVVGLLGIGVLPCQRDLTLALVLKLSVC